jgi:hypothetical protein
LKGTTKSRKEYYGGSQAMQHRLYASASRSNPREEEIKARQTDPITPPELVYFFVQIPK